MADLLDCVEVETGDPVQASVVWLHGLGADGHDFEPIVPELKLPAGLGVRFVFPHAPVRPVTLNAGMAMRAWFDIVSLDRSGPQDEAGLKEAAAAIEALIDNEVARGIARERIVLAGFSQGGAVALHVGLSGEGGLAGIMGLSTYLPIAQRLKPAAAGAATPPLFLAHGSYDPVLPLALGEWTRDALQERGYAAEWHTYPMAHAVCAEEIAAVSAWLSKRFQNIAT